MTRAAAHPAVPDRDLWLAVALALANDVGLIWLTGQAGGPAAFAVYFFDYATRIAALWLVLRHAGPRWRLLLAVERERRRPLLLFGDVLALSGVFFTVYAFFWIPALQWISVYEPLFGYPPYPNGPTALLDLTFGLMLVALHEEVIFRRLLLRRLRRAGLGVTMAVLAGALIFASIHWGTGGANVARAFAFGLAAGYFYAKTGRLFAVTLAHYLYNLYAFGF